MRRVVDALMVILLLLAVVVFAGFAFAIWKGAIEWHP